MFINKWLICNRLNNDFGMDFNKKKMLNNHDKFFKKKERNLFIFFVSLQIE